MPGGGHAPAGPPRTAADPLTDQEVEGAMRQTTEQRATGQRVYVGVRTGDGPGDTAVYVEQGGRRRPLRYVVHHSPSTPRRMIPGLPQS